MIRRKTFRRSIRSAVCTAALLLAIAGMSAGAAYLPAFAADPNYTGFLDPETGEPAGTTTGAESTSGRIKLSEGMYYDWDSHDYVYPISDALGEVHATAADGMILTTPVTISMGAMAPVNIYQNGELFTESTESITALGDYVVTVEREGDKYRLFTFSLLDKRTNSVHNFEAPDGFYITDAERDGENIYEDRYTLSMEAEGTYKITYVCMETDLTYTLETIIDRTPPELTFEGKFDQNGRVHSALTYAGLENGDTVTLMLEGEEVSPTLYNDGTGKIVDPGSYMLYVTDIAGNMSQYHFTILLYFNSNSLVFLALLCAIMVGVAVYMIIKRRSLKIG